MNCLSRDSILSFVVISLQCHKYVVTWLTAERVSGNHKSAVRLEKGVGLASSRITKR